MSLAVSLSVPADPSPAPATASQPAPKGEGAPPLRGRHQAEPQSASEHRLPGQTHGRGRVQTDARFYNCFLPK